MTNKQLINLDDLAKQYLAARQRKELADDELKSLRDRLLPLVQEHGIVPEKAEKSRRIESAFYELTASFGESVKIDDELAEQFVVTCQQSDASEVRSFAERVFAWRVKYSLAAGAHQAMSAKLPAGAPRTLRSLFAKAVSVEKTSPSLTVKLRKQAPAEDESVPAAVAAGSRSRNGKRKASAA